MIVCPNCNHQNPDGAIQCEACYTPLPAMTECPVCGASVQSDASFCGQCGANLSAPSPNNEVGTAAETEPIQAINEGELGSIPSLDLPDVEIPDLVEPEALAMSEPLVATPEVSPPSPSSPMVEREPPSATVPTPDPVTSPTQEEPTAPQVSSAPTYQTTQLQTQTVRLIHTKSDIPLELPPHLTVIHIGKPNDRVPPDIDVSGFPDSEVVSRVHADIRVEGDQYYLEDVGSSNGTYVNNVPLLPGNRHRLRTGDRIALGKGDKVSFIVQIT